MQYSYEFVEFMLCYLLLYTWHACCVYVYIVHVMCGVRYLSCVLVGGLLYTKWPLDVRSLGHRDAIARDSVTWLMARECYTLQALVDYPKRRLGYSAAASFPLAKIPRFVSRRTPKDTRRW